MNAARSEIRRLANRRAVAVTISPGGFSGAVGTVGTSFGIAELLRVRRMARRRATVWSLGSGWSFE
jgi:cysteine synthase